MLGSSIDWKDLAAAIRLDLCKNEAERHGGEMPPWYYMSTTLEGGGHTPFNPLTDDITMEDEEGTVSAKVPVCAIWNLLDDKSEEQVPLMAFAEWLNFLRGRSQMDQERMRLIMLRVLLRSRCVPGHVSWIARGGGATTGNRSQARGISQESGCSAQRWTQGPPHVERVPDLVLEPPNRDAGGRVRLQERLADSESQAEDLKAELAVGKAMIAACKARAEQERLQSEERLAEATRKINTLRVEEVELKDALGRSQVAVRRDLRG